MTLKFQQGGTLPLSEYLPFTGLLTAQDAQVPAVSSGTSGTGEKLQDLLKLVSLLKGLPSDTGKLIEDLQDIYNEVNLYNNGELDTSDLTTTYLSTLLKMKFAEFNDAQFKLAEKDVRENGGLHDYAIDEAGRLIVQSLKTGKIKHMSLEDLYKQGQDGEYAPLTNSNLLYYRSQSPDFAFKNDFIDIVSNGIGHDKVTEILQKALSKVGSSIVGEEGYTARQHGEITKGLNILKSLIAEGKASEDIWGLNGLLSLDGLYKTSSLTQDLKEQIESVADYLWHTLPRNARTWLAIKSGNTADPNKGAHDLMMTMLFASENTSSKFLADYLKDLNPNGTKKEGSGGSSSSGTDLDPVKAFILGKGYSQPITFNQGTSVAITVNGIYSTLVDHSGNQLGNNSTLQDVTNSTFAPVLDFDNASMGGQLLNKRGLDRVLLNNADIVRMDLPVDLEALQKGILKPDFALTAKLEQAEYQIATLNITDPDEINKVYESFGLPAKWRNDGKTWTIDEMRYQSFAAMQGMAEENAFLEDPTFDDTLQEVLDAHEREGFERAIAKDGEKKYSISEGFFGMGATNIFAGTIFVPIRLSSIAASLGSRDYYLVPVKDATTVEALEQEAKRTSGYKKAPALSSLT